MKLIIFKEKYVTRYFRTTTDADLYRVAFKIFKERVQEGWYSFSEIEEPSKPEVPKEDADKYPDLCKRSILESWSNYEKDLKYNSLVLKERRLYDKALKDKKGDIILTFLNSRQDNEYEQFEITKTEEY